MQKDVKSAVADILKQEGIEYIFGYTGGHISPMWEAANNRKIKLILNRQEGNAVYMADAYARLSKKPSVILGTAGPGVTNMVTGLSSALLDSIPLVVIGATVPTVSFGRNAVQDGSGRGRAIEQRLVFKSVCKQAMLAPSPKTVPDMVREAFRLAMSGRPGPVYIEIPSDFWEEKIVYEVIDPGKYKNLNIPKCDPNDCKNIASQLYKANNPLIIIGEGADEPGVDKKLNAFLNKLKVPFAASPMSKDFINEFNPLYLGVPRSCFGKKHKVYEYMKKSDFILFLGDRMQEWEMNWYDESLIKNAKLAQVDPDYGEIGRVYPVDLSAVGSISSFVDSVDVKEHAKSARIKKEIKELNQEFLIKKRHEDGNGIHPLNINYIAEDLAAKDAVIICDTGYAKSMAVMKFRTKLSQRFIVADKYGPMGYSVPAALGAALKTGKEVICFTGDGGFQMTLNELGTAMQYKLKVIYIIEDNGGCASIAHLNMERHGHSCADSFTNPDFASLADSYNLKGFQVKTTKEFEDVFKKAQKAKDSVIIATKIDQAKMIE